MMLPDPPGERSPAALLAFGVVNLDKPPGPSAHQVAAWARDVAGQDRAAHAGTLDPKVTGCLPTLLGRATRIARVFDDSVKEYVAVLHLQGPAPSDLEAVVDGFEGEILQTPPRRSAVVRERRVRTIHDVEVLEREGRRVLLRVVCEAGTYVRKLCHDLGLALGTGAHMGDLRRTATGSFDDTTLQTMHDLVDAVAFWKNDDDPGPLRKVVQPAERALEALPRVVIAESAAREVAEGAPVYAPGVLETRDAPGGETTIEREEPVVCVLPDGAAVSLGPLVGDPASSSGTVVTTDRVLV
ncbi:MAG: RNA-guided pseudouridylation complex pseudouridine synthase subunit Cbf5 [Salinirussus sp.]